MLVHHVDREPQDQCHYKQENKAPYTSANAAITVITAYRNRGLGTPFTPDVLIRAGVSESIANRTIQAFRLLELVDDAGNPTPQFESLREARGQEEFETRLQEWLQSVYRGSPRLLQPE